jgi:hypothetical protein
LGQPAGIRTGCAQGAQLLGQAWHARE